MKATLRFLIYSWIASTIFFVCPARAQDESYTVAIFLYDGVELLDFAGPGEVFAAAGFKVYTVTVDGEEIRSQGFVTVKPQYGLSDAPDPDVVVFPGGGSGPTSNNQKVINWLNGRVANGAVGMSVCTGASVLANAGLLKGLNVTTWHGFIPVLQELHPDMKVLDNARYVDSGNIITTAGVAAGIDGALHLVARIKGLDVAKATARYMEYDKWDPSEGRVDITNSYITELSSQVNLVKEPTISSFNDARKPFLGELKNLALDLNAKGRFKEEARVLEVAVKLYPGSGYVYKSLGEAYRKIGKSAPSGEDAYVAMLEAGKVAEMQAMYEKDRKAFPEWKLIDEQRVNQLGYRMLEQKKFDLAVKIFEENTRLFPKSAKAFDSLGEGYLKAGKKAQAVTNYKRSLELNPANDNARKVLEKIQTGEL